MVLVYRRFAILVQPESFKFNTTMNSVSPSMSGLCKALIISVIVIFYFPLFAFSPPQKAQTGLFIENKGQVRDQHYMSRPDVLYYGEVDGLSFHMTAAGVHYQMVQYPEGFQQKELLSKTTRSKHDLDVEAQEQPITIYRVDVNYLGANERAEVVSDGGSSSVSHFYNVPHGAEPALNVRSWQSVIMKEIYENIDLRYYQGKHGGLESDFMVQPGADYRQIAFTISGAKLSINDRGELVMHTPFGDILEGPVFAHQNGKEVASHWVVDGEVVRFELVGKVDPSLPLIIDPPVRLYGTYYGGSKSDSYEDIKVSANGKFIAYGQTASLTQIATIGAHQIDYGGGIGDCLLSSYTSAGGLEWVTYYGGVEIEEPENCSTHSDGSIIIVGRSASEENIATIGSNQESKFGGFDDGFVAKFNSSGLRIWGTYFGGESFDNINGCDIHSSGNVLICGSTRSKMNIATTGAFQETKTSSGDFDAFLAKFTESGELIWSTYAGLNSGEEIGNSCQFDSESNIVMVGSVDKLSKGTLATPNAYQSTIPNWYSALLMKFDNSGGLLWCTYYGGSETRAMDVSIGTDNSIYIVGTTEDSSFIVSPGAYQSEYGGGFNDGFIARFSFDGQLLWGTCYGGPSKDLLLSCAVNSVGDLFVGGETSSITGIATSEGFDKIKDGAVDGCMARFDANGNIKWSSYYGGSNYDYIKSIKLIDDNQFVVSGTSNSTDAIATPDGNKTSNSGSYDAFFAIFQDETSGLIPAVQVEPLAVSPNPTSGMVSISDLPESGRLTVRDVQGVVVMERTVTTNALDLDLGHLPSGMYILRVDADVTQAIKVARVVVE